MHLENDMTQKGTHIDSDDILAVEFYGTLPTLKVCRRGTGNELTIHEVRAGHDLPTFILRREHE